MIYAFSVGGEVVLFRVDDSKDLWMTGRNLGQEWTSMRAMMKPEQEDDVALTEAIVKHLPEEWHEKYLKAELHRAGLKFLRKMTEAEYAVNNR